MGQIPIVREKCKTCGKIISKCKCNDPKPVQNCKSCGMSLSKCPYKGKHPKPVQTSNVTNLQVTGGVYSGEVRNGKPHGKGTLTFNTDAVISKYDINNARAHAGESVEGNFENGVFYRGIYHSKSGNKKVNFGSQGNN